MRWSHHEERIYILAKPSRDHRKLLDVCLPPPTNRFASGTYTNRIITMGRNTSYPHIFFYSKRHPRAETSTMSGFGEFHGLNALSSPLFLSIIYIVAVPFHIIREMFKPIDQRKAPAGKQWRLPGPRGIPIFGSPPQFHKARHDSAQLFQ